jgi:hypothetical protein
MAKGLRPISHPSDHWNVDLFIKYNTVYIHLGDTLTVVSMIYLPHFYNVPAFLPSLPPHYPWPLP